jgi:polysaccharide transporter, PST family
MSGHPAFMANKELAQVFKNFTALGFVQLTNYLLPLVTIPYLINTIGIESFGVVSIVQSVLMYFVIIPDYGFNLTTTAQISKQRSDSYQLSKLVSLTLTTKSILLLIALVLLVLLIVTRVSLFANEPILFLLGFSIVLGQAYFPMWFFQGIEKLSYITYLNFASRLLVTLLIFIRIKVPQDYILVIPIYASGGVLASFLGLLIIFRKFKINFNAPTRIEIKEALKNGFPFFVSTFSSNLYSTVGFIILGILAPPYLVGLFAVTEKILTVFRQIVLILSQSIYPTMCRLREEAEDKLYPMLQRVGILFSAFMLAIAIILAFFPSLFSIIFIGSVTPELIFLIKLIAPAPLLIYIGMLANQILLVYGFKHQSMLVYLIGSCASILINFFLIQGFQAIGAAYGVLIVEFLIAVLMLCFLKNTGVLKRFK